MFHSAICLTKFAPVSASQLENLTRNVYPNLEIHFRSGFVFSFKSVFESLEAFKSFPLIFFPSSHSDLLPFFTTLIKLNSNEKPTENNKFFVVAKL